MCPASGVAALESGDTGFDKSKRLLRASDYARVFDTAEAKASHRYVLLLAVRNSGARHRLGLVIAKKNVRLAVQRNRIKRQAREFFRGLPIGQPALDVVLLTRRGVDQLDNAQLSFILREQWAKLSSRISQQVNRQDG